MNVASLELCKELYELSGWERTEDHRLIEKVWMESFSTWEMGQGNPDYATTPPDKRRGYTIGEYRVTDNPRNHIGIPEHVPWGWANRYYQQVEARAIPAYDLGYLLRKLPAKQISLLLTVDGWYCTIRNNQGVGQTFEDAAAKLAIELFRQGVLQKAVE